LIRISRRIDLDDLNLGEVQAQLSLFIHGVAKLIQKVEFKAKPHRKSLPNLYNIFTPPLKICLII